MVDHEREPAARTQHARDLADHAVGVGRVVDDAPRPDEVEARIRIRERFGVGLAHVGDEPGEREPPSRQLDRGRRQVDGRDVRAGCGEQPSMDTGAAADLEDVVPAELVERDEAGEGRCTRTLREPRLGEEPSLDLCEMLGTARLVGNLAAPVVRHRVIRPPAADVLLRAGGLRHRRQLTVLARRSS